MAPRDENTPSSERKHFLNLEMKDVIQYVTIIFSVVFFYFSQIQTQDRRITILETKMQTMETNIFEIKDDVKSILNATRRMQR